MSDSSAPTVPRAGAHRTARALAREQITGDLLTAARAQLATVGAEALSLRAVAREVGMASSAVYRYFPSRDALLTALIIEAYDAVGDVAERAAAETASAGPAEQFRAVWRAVRSWARANRHEYALIFGSPVPGYAAPTDTIEPATRLPRVLLDLLASSDAHPSTPLTESALRSLAAALAPARATVPADAIDDATLLAALTSWAGLFGAISFELFGHTHNVVSEDDADAAAFFDAQLDLMLALVGFATQPG